MRLDGGRAVGLGMAALGAVVVAAALGLAEGTETGGPGTQFLPALVGGCLVLLGGAVALGPAARAAGGEARPTRGGWMRAAGTVGTLVAYALAFEPLGFLVATAPMLAILLLAYGERRVPVIVGVAVAATGATYALFALWLRVPLPKGVLGP